MPLEELLAIYRYEASAGSSIDSSSGDLTDELPDMTLDKVNNCFYLAVLHSYTKNRPGKKPSVSSLSMAFSFQLNTIDL